MTESVLQVRIQDDTRRGAETARRNTQRLEQQLQATVVTTGKFDAAQERLANRLRRAATASQRLEVQQQRVVQSADRAALAQRRLALATQRVEEAEQRAARGSAQWRRGLSSLHGALLAVGGGLVVGQVVSYADAWTLLTNRIRLFTDSAEETAQVQDRLFGIARDTRSDLQATVELYQRLSQANQNLGLAQAQLLGITETVNRAIIISGVSADSARAAIIQLGQGLASGELRGEELRSVLEQTPRLAQAIADGLGVSIGGLRDLAEQGETTASRVIMALQSQAGVIDEEFGRVNVSVGAAFTVLSNAMTRAIGQFSDATGAANILSRAITGIAEAIDGLSAEDADVSGTVTAAAQRRANRQRNQFDQFQNPLIPSIPAPPPGLTPVQRRQFFRGRTGFTPSGFAGAIGVGFDSSVAAPRGPSQPFDPNADLAGQTDVLGRQAVTLTVGGALEEMEREFDDFFDGLLADFAQTQNQIAQDVATRPSGRITTPGRTDLFGRPTDLPIGGDELNRIAQQVNQEYSDTLGELLGDLDDLDPDRASEGVRELNGTLLQLGFLANDTVGSLASIVVGGVTGGPLGAFTGGIGLLDSILAQTTNTALEAAAALERHNAAISQREGTVAGASLRARQVLDPSGVAAAQASVGEVVRRLFDQSGGVDNFFTTLADLDRGVLGADDAEGDQAAFSPALRSLLNQLEAAGVTRGFGDISFVDLGNQLIATGDAFADLRDAAQGVIDTFETERSIRLRFNAEEIALRTRFARDFQRAGGDVFEQRRLFEEFEQARLGIAAQERQAQAGVGGRSGPLGGGFVGGGGRGGDNPAFEMLNEGIEEFLRLIAEEFGPGFENFAMLFEDPAQLEGFFGLFDDYSQVQAFLGLFDNYTQFEGFIGLFEDVTQVGAFLHLFDDTEDVTQFMVLFEDRASLTRFIDLFDDTAHLEGFLGMFEDVTQLSGFINAFDDYAQVGAFLGLFDDLSDMEDFFGTFPDLTGGLNDLLLTTQLTERQYQLLTSGTADLLTTTQLTTEQYGLVHSSLVAQFVQTGQTTDAAALLATGILAFHGVLDPAQSAIETLTEGTLSAHEQQAAMAEAQNGATMAILSATEQQLAMAEAQNGATEAIEGADGLTAAITGGTAEQLAMAAAQNAVTVALEGEGGLAGAILGGTAEQNAMAAAQNVATAAIMGGTAEQNAMAAAQNMATEAIAGGSGFTESIQGATAEQNAMAAAQGATTEAIMGTDGLNAAIAGGTAEQNAMAAAQAAGRSEIAGLEFQTRQQTIASQRVTKELGTYLNSLILSSNTLLEMQQAGQAAISALRSFLANVQSADFDNAVAAANARNQRNRNTGGF